MQAAGKRIAVVGPIYGGSVSIAACTVRALDRLGHDVSYIDSTGHKEALDAARRVFPEEARAAAVAGFLERVRRECRESLAELGPEIVIYLAQAPATRDEDVAQLRDKGVPTIFWFVEDHRMFSYWQKLPGRFDHIWHIEPGDFGEQLRQRGQRFVDYVPMACDPALHCPFTPPAGDLIDVSFAGSPYPNRVALLRGLAGLADLHLFGPRWSQDPLLAPHADGDAEVPHVDLPLVFARSRINLNLSSAVEVNQFAVRKSFVNPRAFEIAGSGGFQLCESFCPIEWFFDPGREVVIFDDAADARDKITYYLAHETERRAIAEAGHRRAMAAHTYDRRLAEALERAALVDPRLG